ncbi:MAG: DUF1152 domain-containing protein, partial [Salinigranum sp.]
METLEAAFDHDRALVFGIGGGGDVVGAVPTARLLESHGVETIVGGVTWERMPTDPRPGPRRLDELRGVEPVSSAVARATPDTRTLDGVVLSETHVARLLDDDVVLVDINGGVEGTAAGLRDACEALDVDLVIGTDSGGDALARGGEPGLASPLADAVVLGALTALDLDAGLGVFGYGSDGELTVSELDDALARIAGEGGLLGSWGLTPRVVRELEPLLEAVPTEASRLPVEAAGGAIGERAIRDGERALTLTPASTVTFYFDPATVVETS